MRIKEYNKLVSFGFFPTINKTHGILFIKNGREIEIKITDVLSSNNYIKRIVGYVEQNGF
ncbi:MAG: hypothetical protein OXJ52_04735 [Oligoflexia bacterium]|nr:hypothetical protein [Oligoflexia bacterium]